MGSERADGDERADGAVEKLPAPLSCTEKQARMEKNGTLERVYCESTVLVGLFYYGIIAPGMNIR